MLLKRRREDNYYTPVTADSLLPIAAPTQWYQSIMFMFPLFLWLHHVIMNDSKRPPMIWVSDTILSYYTQTCGGFDFDSQSRYPVINPQQQAVLSKQTDQIPARYKHSAYHHRAICHEQPCHYRSSYNSQLIYRSHCRAKPCKHTSIYARISLDIWGDGSLMCKIFLQRSDHRV